jgi:hypothetical protein
MKAISQKKVNKKKKTKKRPEIFIKTDLSFDEIIGRAMQFDEKGRKKKD